jgi:hypothetical protein
VTQSRKPHPYKAFDGSALWRLVERQIAALAKNRDIQEMTAREYIVGSIGEAIAGQRDSD